MSENIPVLKLDRIYKKLGGRPILENISLELYPGEVFGFLGPNGSGKTTTIKLILGLLNIDIGSISVCGYDVKKDFEKAIVNVGGIVENPEMYKYLTGRENLEQYARIYGNIPSERIDEVIKIVGLEARINDKIAKYSLGMRQRLGIAQAILHSPKLLVLDEPTNGLDPAGIKDLREIFKKLAHEEGCAVFVSSHMLAELELMCDRVAIIDHGKVVDIKTLDAIHNSVNEDSIEYTLETSNVEKACTIIRSIVGDLRVDPNTGKITFTTSKDIITNVTKELVLNDCEIYGLEKQIKSLEDAFIEMTDTREGGVGQ